jgi:hypothetical protein
MISSREHAAPKVFSSMVFSLIEMFILMVDEIFSIFPSSKALGAGIGFLT